MAKRKKKAMLPKRIAGRKIPKALRTAGWPALLTSPIGAGVVSNLITAAAIGLASHEARPGSKVRRSAYAAGEGAERAGGAVAESASTLSFALTQAARTFVDTLKAGDPEAHFTPDNNPPERALPTAPTTAAERRRGQNLPQGGSPAH